MTTNHDDTLVFAIDLITGKPVAMPGEPDKDLVESLLKVSIQAPVAGGWCVAYTVS